MSKIIKMRALLKGEITEIKLLMSHPMETGRRKNELKEMVPAHFIQLVVVTLNGKPIIEAQWGTGVSKDPYLVFHVRGARVGDMVGVTWHDNKGETGAGEISVMPG
jgi:sulfur-oxidizing protein SoxZ